MTDRTRELMTMVRDADPASPQDRTNWATSTQAEAVLRMILASEVSVVDHEPKEYRTMRVVLVAVAIVLAAAAGAAAGEILGTPAPATVQQDFTNVDVGMPADLRLNPDVRDARLAAVTEGAALYFATLSDGGYCLEIVTDADGARGAVCTPGAAVGSLSIEITAPFTDPITATSPIVVGGRVNVAASSLEARFADGVTGAIPLGAESFYVFSVPNDELAGAHTNGLELIARDATGAVTGSSRVPPSETRRPEATDRLMPIFVSTISTHEDFTKVLGVEGRVNVGHAVRLELRYPDATTVRIAIDGQGRYRYLLPSGRQDDLAELPGTLTAYDAEGQQVATAPVASVAYWHGLG
ncbi:MAG: hypothetical protein ABJB55_03130 [Actinomycetota bacterium]